MVPSGSTSKRCLSTILLLGLLSLTADASSGDRAPEYQHCVHLCEIDQCTPTSPNPITLALPLRLTRWTCTDNCKYGCMHLITEKAITAGREVEQYHGKWPFVRFGGMQEPASVAFSLMNLWAHVWGLGMMRRAIKDGHPMKSFYVTWAYVSMNAWVWSAVFHTRDTPSTEKLDYFSAAASILYGLYVAVIRLFHFYPSITRSRLTTASSSPSHLQRQPTRSPLLTAWSILCLTIYLAHTSYLTLLPRFDYSYNMAFNVCLGITHNFIWALFSLPTSLPFIKRFRHYPHTYRPTYAWKPLAFVGLTTAATALELFDFAPWGQVVDAHALWHLSTVPLAVFWYRFLVQDACDDAWRSELIKV